MHKWNCLAITHKHTHSHSHAHWHTHTRTQYIRFQSINIAYTQRAPWHKKDAAAGDKQTNKQAKTKPTLAQFINLSKGHMQEEGKSGGEGKAGRGGCWQHTPGQVERF